MSDLPDWATWSLGDSVRQSSRGSLGGTSGKDDGGSALFTRTAQDDMHGSAWHEVSSSNCPGSGDDEDLEAGIEGVDLDKLFKGSGGKGNVESSVRGQRELAEAGSYRFDPLGPVESSALERALKLSGYIPPTVKEKEEESRRLMAVKVVPYESRDRRQGGMRINEETGKRIHNLATGATGATGVIAKENNEAKKVLQAMCKSMLPRRHFDWILAQLTYNKCNMLGFDNILTRQSLVQEAARDSVLDGSMPMYNLAYVTKLLAEATSVDTSEFDDVVDPTRGKRIRGFPAIQVRHKMQKQSAAIFDAMKELFPSLFAEGNSRASSAARTKRGSREGSASNSKAKTETGKQGGINECVSSASANALDVLPGPVQSLNAWNGKQPRQAKLTKELMTGELKRKGRVEERQGDGAVEGKEGREVGPRREQMAGEEAEAGGGADEGDCEATAPAKKLKVEESEAG